MIPCYVINMEQDVGRKENIIRQLDVLGMSYTIFNAVNGKTLNAEEIAQHYDRENAVRELRELVPGEIGCALSHLGVYKKIVEKDLPVALVLEDDANLLPESLDFPPLLDVLQKLKTRFNCNDPVVVLLSHVRRYRKHSLISLVGKLELADTYGETFMAYAYFITNSAARRLLENTYPIRMPCDQWHTFQECGYVQVKAVVPYCVGLSEFWQESSITPDRSVAQKKQKGKGFYYYFYEKFIFQIFVKHLLSIRRQKKTW